jgi:hypothetical protein
LCRVCHARAESGNIAPQQLSPLSAE